MMKNNTVNFIKKYFKSLIINTLHNFLIKEL